MPILSYLLRARQGVYLKRLRDDLKLTEQQVSQIEGLLHQEALAILGPYVPEVRAAAWGWGTATAEPTMEPTVRLGRGMERRRAIALASQKEMETILTPEQYALFWNWIDRTWEEEYRQMQARQPMAFPTSTPVPLPGVPTPAQESAPSTPTVRRPLPFLLPVIPATEDEAIRMAFPYWDPYCIIENPHDMHAQRMAYGDYLRLANQKPATVGGAALDTPVWVVTIKGKFICFPWVLGAPTPAPRIYENGYTVLNAITGAPMEGGVEELLLPTEP